MNLKAFQYVILVWFGFYVYGYLFSDYVWLLDRVSCTGAMQHYLFQLKLYVQKENSCQNFSNHVLPLC